MSNQGSRLEGNIAGCSAAGSLLRATQAAAGPDRSKHWKRSTPSLARSANAVPPPSSFPARAGLVPRSPARGTETIPQCQEKDLPPPPADPKSRTVPYPHFLTPFPAASVRMGHSHCGDSGWGPVGSRLTGLGALANARVHDPYPRCGSPRALDRLVAARLGGEGGVPQAPRRRSGPSGADCFDSRPCD